MVKKNKIFKFKNLHLIQSTCFAIHQERLEILKEPWYLIVILLLNIMQQSISNGISVKLILVSPTSHMLIFLNKLCLFFLWLQDQPMDISVETLLFSLMTWKPSNLPFLELYLESLTESTVKSLMMSTKKEGQHSVYLIKP